MASKQLRPDEHPLQGPSLINLRFELIATLSSQVLRMHATSFSLFLGTDGSVVALAVAGVLENLEDTIRRRAQHQRTCIEGLGPMS